MWLTSSPILSKPDSAGPIFLTLMLVRTIIRRSLIIRSVEDTITYNVPVKPSVAVERHVVMSSTSTVSSPQSVHDGFVFSPVSLPAACFRRGPDMGVLQHELERKGTFPRVGTSSYVHSVGLASFTVTV